MGGRNVTLQLCMIFKGVVDADTEDVLLGH